MLAMCLPATEEMEDGLAVLLDLGLGAELGVQQCRRRSEVLRKDALPAKLSDGKRSRTDGEAAGTRARRVQEWATRLRASMIATTRRRGIQQ